MVGLVTDTKGHSATDWCKGTMGGMWDGWDDDILHRLHPLILAFRTCGHIMHAYTLTTSDISSGVVLHAHPLGKSPSMYQKRSGIRQRPGAQPVLYPVFVSCSIISYNGISQSPPIMVDSSLSLKPLKWVLIRIRAEKSKSHIAL